MKKQKITKDIYIAEAGVIRQMRDMLSSWLDNSSINN